MRGPEDLLGPNQFTCPHKRPELGVYLPAHMKAMTGGPVWQGLTTVLTTMLGQGVDHFRVAITLTSS